MGWSDKLGNVKNDLNGTLAVILVPNIYVIILQAHLTRIDSVFKKITEQCTVMQPNAVKCNQKFLYSIPTMCDLMQM